MKVSSPGMRPGTQLAALLGFIAALSLAAARAEPGGEARYPGELYLPTHVTKVGEHYFIVDSYNNRVLYNHSLDPEVGEWTILDQGLHRPHSIASNGVVYLVDDTDAHKLNVYRWRDGRLLRTQRLGNVGTRPHRTVYDASTEAFYVVGSMSQTITKLTESGGEVRVWYTRRLPFLEGAYVRSIRIMDGLMYFVSGPGRIFAADYASDSYEVVRSWRVPAEYRSMNDLSRLGDQYLITATMRKIIRCPTLEDLERNACEDLFERLDFKANPYYISRFDGRYYVTEVDDYNGIKAIEVDESGDIRNHYFAIRHNIHDN